MRVTLKFLLVVAGLICFADLAIAAEDAAIDSSIERGLQWVRANPASCQDGGFLDILDEGLFYLTLERLSADIAPTINTRDAMQACIARLEASPGFARSITKPEKTLIEHYHLLLATHIIERVRQPMASRNTVIEQAQRTLAKSNYENPTFRLTVALLIRHLGAKPRIDLNPLLDASLINRLQDRDRNPGPTQLRTLLQHPLAYYALVHEIAALTDFGRLPPSPWLKQRSHNIIPVLQAGSRQAMKTGRVDLLAEILLSHEMLDQPISGRLDAGVDYLIATQHEDGSWGEQATPRANRLRHAVQTATAALMAYRSQSSGERTQR